MMKEKVAEDAEDAADNLTRAHTRLVVRSLPSFYTSQFPLPLLLLLWTAVFVDIQMTFRHLCCTLKFLHFFDHRVQMRLNF